MLYYVIEISTGDSAIAGKAIYEYSDEASATATFHQKLATAMKSDLYSTELVLVMDEYGGVHRSERYVKEVTE